MLSLKTCAKGVDTDWTAYSALKLKQLSMISDSIDSDKVSQLVDNLYQSEEEIEDIPVKVPKTFEERKQLGRNVKLFLCTSLMPFNCERFFLKSSVQICQGPISFSP